MPSGCRYECAPHEVRAARTRSVEEL